MASEEKIQQSNGGPIAAQHNRHGRPDARAPVPWSALEPPPATPLSDRHATRTRLDLHGPTGQRGQDHPAPPMHPHVVAPLRQQEPGYRLRPVPQLGWTAAPSRRRTRVSRAILLGIVLLQALLSIRLHNTAFNDEALYLYIGRLQRERLFRQGLPNTFPAPRSFIRCLPPGSSQSWASPGRVP